MLHVILDSDCALHEAPSPRGQRKFASPVKFTTADDERLRLLVEQFGDSDWSLISDQMNGRNPRQCRERWINYLAPSLNNAPWTPAEDMLLFQKYKELGCKWVRIAKFFPDRTDAMVKNRFNRIQRRETKEQELRRLCDPIILRILGLRELRPRRRRAPKVQEPPAPDQDTVQGESALTDDWQDTMMFGECDFFDAFCEL
jgi:hypothetical protein